MPIQVTNISDALLSTLNKLDRGKLTDAMSNYRSTTALKRVFANSSKSKVESGGNEFNFNLITGTNNSFRDVGLGHTPEVDTVNVTLVGKMPWRRYVWNWAIEEQVVQMNSGPEQVLDMAKTQRLAGMGSAVEGMERLLWSCPTLAEFNSTKAVGIPYFVVKSSTDATTDSTRDGFNGNVPSGFTTVANLTPTTDASGRYMNYADIYVNVTKPDLISRMRRASAKTNFEPLVDGIPSNEDGGMDREIYMNYNTRAQFVDAAENQNDNLGPDVASMEGRVTFMRNSLKDIDALKTDLTNPVYMIDWSCFGTKRLKNFWMKELHFPGSKNPNQPTMTFTEVIMVFNMYCTNRRKQSVLSTGTTMYSPP